MRMVVGAGRLLIRGRLSPDFSPGAGKGGAEAPPFQPRPYVVRNRSQSTVRVNLKSCVSVEDGAVEVTVALTSNV